MLRRGRNIVLRPRIRQDAALSFSQTARFRYRPDQQLILDVGECCHNDRDPANWGDRRRLSSLDFDRRVMLQFGTAALW